MVNESPGRAHHRPQPGRATPQEGNTKQRTSLLREPGCPSFCRIAAGIAESYRGSPPSTPQPPPITEPRDLVLRGRAQPHTAIHALYLGVFGSYTHHLIATADTKHFLESPSCTFWHFWQFWLSHLW